MEEKETTTDELAAMNAIENATGVDVRREDQKPDEKAAKVVRANFNSPVIIAKYICRDNPNLVKTGSGDLLYKYNGKYYDFLTEKDLDRMVLDFCMKYNVSKAFKSISLILRALKVYPEIKVVEKMNLFENLICLDNCILDIYTKEVFPHDPKYFFDYSLAVKYDVKANKCPVFVKFLNDIFSGDQETVSNIIRLGGYLLDTSCNAKKCFFFDGLGANGKSTLIDTFTMFFPKRERHPVVTSLSLEALSKNGFDSSDLIYSRFNLCSETKKGYYDAEFLKLMVTGDLITVRPIYSEPITFRYQGKVVLLGNGKPNFKDTSDGIYRRILFIDFNNKYKPAHEIAKIKDAEKRHIYPMDPFLFSKIQGEASAILNLFIEGLINLRKNDYLFIESAKSEIAMSDFKRDNDTVREFLEENYEIDFETQTPLSEVFYEFRSWYMENVQDTKSMKFRSAEMGKRIKEVFDLDSLGRVKFLNRDTHKYELLTAYNVKRKYKQQFETDGDDAVEVIEDDVQLALALGAK